MSLSPKGVTIYFNDDTKLIIEYPVQHTDEYNMISQLHEVLEQKHFLVEADGAMLYIPVDNIKYLQVFPAPTKMPKYAITGATIIDR